MKSLSDKVVFITGAGKGIGRETALAFAAEKCKLVVAYHSNKEEALELAEKCTSLGAADVLTLKLDVTDNDSIEKAVATTVKKYGQVDILINNAGVIRWSRLSEHSFSDIEAQVRTNLEGLIKMTRALLPYIKECIINIASGAGKTAYGGLATYCATKFGVRGFTQSLAKEIDLPVYSVNPDMTATQMTGFQGRHPKEVAKIIVNTAKGKYNLKSGSDVDVWEYA